MRQWYVKLESMIYWKEGLPYNKFDRSSTSRKDQVAGTVTDKGYRQLSVSVEGKEKLLLGHRVKWFMETGEIADLLDHIEPARKDYNEMPNLRKASPSDNMGNRRKGAKKTSSRYKGVYKNKSKTSPWSSCLNTVPKKYLGSFKTEHRAAAAYNEAALEHFGKFALLNK